MTRKIFSALAILFVSAVFGQEAYQLASPEKVAVFRSMLPRTDDAELQAIFDDPTTIWYSHAEMPMAYQHDSMTDSRLGVHDALHNIGPQEPGRRDPFGNGNLEWPWFDPATLDNSDKRVKNFFGLWRPKLDGKPLPVVVYRTTIRSNVMSGASGSYDLHGVAWMYPVGTRFVEVLSHRVGSHDVTWKVLSMQRLNRDWDRKSFRPFPTLASYEAAIGKKVEMPTQVRRLSDPHPNPTYQESRLVAWLPPIDPSLSIKLLTETPFKECIDQEFIPGASAPTTDADGQIVPRGYLGPFVGTRADCANCHADVMTHVSFFQANRDWYGLIRGSDQVFSFHPFHPPSISRNGMHLGIQLCPDLLAAGVVATYDPAKHRAPYYGDPQ